MSNGRTRLLWIVLGLVALCAVAAVAFGLGVNSGNDGGPFFHRRGMGPGMMGWGDGGPGWFGWLPLLILVFVGIFLLVLLLTGDRRYRPDDPAGGAPGGAPGAGGPGAAGPSSPPPANDVDRLRQLSELHERGQLTDEEFTAAKRKLLGL